MRMPALAFLALLGAAPAQGQSVESFYRGRTVSLVIGYSVGGGYDIHGRVLARHLGKHIPGNPGIIVQNMPGGGSLRAANYLYNAAPKDGTTIGVFSRGGDGAADRLEQHPVRLPQVHLDRQHHQRGQRLRHFERI
jgi:tripartite-type tricarboxylate transporter receptor subunit TctC